MTGKRLHERFQKYDFLALPVVDMENRLVGIITVDDAIDVIQEENTEDIQKMAAITPTDTPYLENKRYRFMEKKNSVAYAAYDFCNAYKPDFNNL